MGIFTKDIKTFDDLFLHQLQDIYYAENKIVKKLPGMIEKTTNRDLSAGLKAHLEETKGHVERLEQIFEQLGQKASGKKCAAMNGLIKEGEDVASDTDDNSVRDAGLIAAAQKVEHYEISGYGSVRTHAEMLGHEQAVRLLEETLDEEKQTDQKLNTLAEGMINQRAAHAGREESMSKGTMRAGSSMGSYTSSSGGSEASTGTPATGARSGTRETRR